MRLDEFGIDVDSEIDFETKSTTEHGIKNELLRVSPVYSVAFSLDFDYIEIMLLFSLTVNRDSYSM